MAAAAAAAAAEAAGGLLTFLVLGFEGLRVEF